MASDLNNVTLVARLTRDPELRSLPGGQSVCELRVAFNTSRKTADGWEDEGNFIDVTVWGNQGEALARNLTKGQRIGISGRLQHRTWKDQEGNPRERHSITANSVQYLDPKQDGGNGQHAAARPASAPATPPAQPVQAPIADDDIPF